MAETLGSLCDKLTIIKLKQWHSDDKIKLESLGNQEKQLQEEITDFVAKAISGEIPLERLSFSANKVYKSQGNEIVEISSNIGEIFSKLSQVNCQLWHEQEKVYDFENVPLDQKDIVVKKLAILNLERNQCIDIIDRQFKSTISHN